MFICVRCSGTGSFGNCETCGGTGFVSEKPRPPIQQDFGRVVFGYDENEPPKKPLKRCPECGVDVRVDRLQRHLRRIHNQ
jgi:rRNA maturation endonuclease Nob1